MKGERRPTESSDYEESDDEMKRRRGVRGGLGRGKVMQSEDEDCKYLVLPNLPDINVGQN